ncbi:unnamed protein product [Peniophora sp. CBMAI 1063]|nr:unnamed protein product [Peniophora sp. CBMAI 1063]
MPKLLEHIRDAFCCCRVLSFNSTQRDDRAPAVVDYAAASPAALPLVLDLVVLNRLNASGHAPIALLLAVPGRHLNTANTSDRPRKSVKRDPPPPLPRKTLLNQKLADLVDAARDASPESLLLEMYGTTSGPFKESTAYTDGSCHNNGTRDARASAGVYYGAGSVHNISERVPGAQTNNRAEAYAILLALSRCKLNRALIIRQAVKPHAHTYP